MIEIGGQVDEWVARLRAGESIDWNLEAQLQTLHTLQAGEQFVRDQLDAEREFDNALRESSNA